MIGESDIPRMTPDERYEQAAIAQIGERRNRPTHFVVIGALALCVAVVAVLVAWFSRGAAAKELASREAKLQELASLTSEWLALSKRESSEESEDERIPQSRVRELAAQAGMVATPPLAQPRIDNYQNARRAKYSYPNVRDKSLEALLTWVRLVLAEFKGVWVHEIEIKPSGDAWQLEVVFARWERTST
jgi:hypothetical protein